MMCCIKHTARDFSRHDTSLDESVYIGPHKITDVTDGERYEVRKLLLVLPELCTYHEGIGGKQF
jgi:hypothetical protein